MGTTINKTVRGLVCLAVAAAASIMIVPATNAAETTKVAYVFEENSNAKDSFKALLTDRGYDFRGVRLDRVPTADLSNVDVIIVAADTGDSWWGFHSPEAVQTLNSLQKPILALGVGGSIALDEIAPDFGYNKSMEIRGETSVQVASPGDRVWAEPTAVSAGGDQLVGIYSRPTAQQAIWSGAASDAVVPVANSSEAPYYPLATGKADDGQKVFLWGFYGNARKLSDTGEKLFVNAVERIAPR